MRMINKQLSIYKKLIGEHNKMEHKVIRLLIILVLSAIFFPSCKKLVEVDAPYTSLNGENVFTNNASAISAVTSMYVKLSETSLTGSSLSTLPFFAGLSSDEFKLYSGVLDNTTIAFYQNKLSSTITFDKDYWKCSYPVIYNTNLAIEQLNKANTLIPEVKNQLLGEVKFIRAFYYFYLVNLYGDVPLILGSDYTVNAKTLRTPRTQVWKQIILDLKDAESLLRSDFPDKLLTGTSIERIRPTKWAASALLARVYLYTGDYNEAEITSSKVINNISLFAISEINSTFKANNIEAIWQLQPVNAGWNTEEARLFIIPITGPSGEYPVYLSSWLLNAFEKGDLRKTNWTNHVIVGSDTFSYPYKYKSATVNAPVTEYKTVLRLAEQYLIRSESRIQLGKTLEAISDLNVIRTRAGLDGISGLTDKQSLLNEISHENQVEFFSEWGHRWLDLKRMGKVDEVMSRVTPLKGGGPWDSNKQLYPIPADELKKTPGLQQNPGY